MKILFPTTEYPPASGGISTVAFEQVRGLAAGGDQVMVTTINAEPTEPIAGVTYLNHRTVLGSVARLIPLTRYLLSDATVHNPHFIYSPTYRGFGLPVRITGRRRKIPYAIYFHGTEIKTEVRRRARRFILKQVLQEAAFLATNSENTRQLLLDCFPEVTMDVHAIPPAIDASRFSSAAAQARGRQLRAEWLQDFGADSQDAVILLTMCRMNKQKGIDTVLNAISALKARPLDKRILAVFAGSGPDLEYFQGLARKLELTADVMFAGPVPYVETAAYYRAADIYVQPSRPVGDFLESFGISFLEAQATGLACIGSDWGGVPEAVDAGKSAILVPPNYEEATAAAIRRLATDAQQRKQMGEHGIARAARSSWNAHTAHLRALMTEAVKQHRS